MVYILKVEDIDILALNGSLKVQKKNVIEVACPRIAFSKSYGIHKSPS
jgi:hypothetical protein